MKGWFVPLLLILSCLLWVNAGNSQQTSEQNRHRVLIVFENQSTQTALIEFARGLHAGLDEPRPNDFEIFTEYLDMARFPGQENLDRMAALLPAKYSGMQIDAVVAVGPGALRFVFANRARFAPGAPVFFGLVGEETAKAMNLPPDVRGVASRYDVAGTMALARRLRPDATDAVVIAGSAAFDRNWQDTARAILGSSFEGLAVRYLSGLSLNGFQDAVSNLPNSTVVLMLSIFEDADGKKFVPRNVTAAIAPRSTAPIFSVYDSYLGTGVVGGWMDTFQGAGRQLALLIERTLAGEKDLPQISLSEALPVVDWRAITRFGIDPDLLPPKTDIRFRERSLWEDYRLEILATTAVILLQAGMIAALIAQDRRRRRAEAELARQRLELAHLSRASLLGELSGAFAHELNQPLTAILANAQAAGRLIERNEIGVDELKEILDEIVIDDKRAAGVITELRRLLIKGETTLEPVDLNRVVGETLALARSELVVRQTRIANRTGHSEMPVRGNFAQLQQIVLNLIMNAADATSSRPSSERLIEIDVQRRDPEHCELSVSDNGTGLTEEMRNAAFKPFASTKANGLGLGLAICRSIAGAHGGTLQFDQTYRKGARVVLTLPLDEGRP